MRKSYGPHQALHGIDLEIASGEFAVLVGPSGCGKSTTLRMIAGLESVTGGEITIGEQVVNDIRPKDRGIAMVFQNYALYPNMTVSENMSFALRLQHIPKSEVQARVMNAAGILELTHLLDRKPGALSGGQRQRVAMGRAIVRDPKVFLFDEPLSNLDAKLRTQMRAEIKRLHQRLGNTIVYVTHDQVEAMTLADRIVIMRDGRIEQQGTPDEIFHDPANTFVASFIGSPPMNLNEATVVSGPTGVSLDMGAGQQLHLPDASGRRFTVGQKLVLGIRPEDLLLLDAADPSMASLSVTLDLIEPLGAEKLLHFAWGDANFVGKATGRASIQAGETVRMGLRFANAQFFDAATGQRIR